MNIYMCKHCGNIITKISDSKVSINCCNESMSELIPNITDGATEKHVPIINKDGNKVTISVGSTPHPMTEEHLIKWIALKTANTTQIKYLNATKEPTVTFFSEEEVVNIYSYCNLHGLWKA